MREHCPKRSWQNAPIDSSRVRRSAWHRRFKARECSLCMASCGHGLFESLELTFREPTERCRVAPFPGEPRLCRRAQRSSFIKRRTNESRRKTAKVRLSRNVGNVSCLLNWLISLIATPHNNGHDARPTTTSVRKRIPRVNSSYLNRDFETGECRDG